MKDRRGGGSQSAAEPRLYARRRQPEYEPKSESSLPVSAGSNDKPARKNVSFSNIGNDVWLNCRARQRFFATIKLFDDPLNWTSVTL